MLLTVKEAAERLTLSQASVYQLCKSGRLQHMRIGTGRGRIRIDEKALEKYLLACQIEATTPVETYSRPRASSEIDVQAYEQSMRILRDQFGFKV